jgi:hypothetical protein
MEDNKDSYLIGWLGELLKISECKGHGTSQISINAYTDDN